MKKKTTSEQSVFVQVMSALAIGAIFFVIAASLGTWIPKLFVLILGMP